MRQKEREEPGDRGYGNWKRGCWRRRALDSDACREIIAKRWKG
jgi:hypothetical protein